MGLRDFLNEFELDWAQAPVRSELIDGKKLKGARVLLVGRQTELLRAIAWSFLAWNDEKKAGIRVAAARLGELSAREAPKLTIQETFTEEGFLPEEADYILLTGFCCRETEMDVSSEIRFLREFQSVAEASVNTGCRRILLLSDGRVYGTLGHEFFASEYEAGKTSVEDGESYKAQYLLQSMEGILISTARTAGKAYNILRTGLIYGPCIPMMEHDVLRLARSTASGEEQSLPFTVNRNSYICIHDVLTAIQFVLTRCPENKILNVSGLDSDKSASELAVTLCHNFPEQYRISLTREQHLDETGGILLNTQLIRHYGFQPRINMEDGLIILVKSLQNTGEVFIFDNTYFGKLEKVQQILLGYLLEIDRICKKYDIKYFLAGGTLLGAIRHHGFIPWDDDADVMMLREDYDRFLAVVQQEMPDNIFLQLPHTEQGNHNPFTKLRINNTMFATEFTGHFMDMHNGIFFDVLSHDQTGNHPWSQKLHLMATMLTRSVVFNKWGDTDIKGGGAHPIICKIVDHVKYLIPMPFAEWAQNKCLTFFKNRKTDYLYDGMGRNLKRGAFPKKWLEEAVYVDFEGYQFPVPKEYDKYLTYLYGDYMQMIPVSQRRTSHSIVLTDLGEYADFRTDDQTER